MRDKSLFQEAYFLCFPGIIFQGHTATSVFLFVFMIQIDDIKLVILIAWSFELNYSTLMDKS